MEEKFYTGINIQWPISELILSGEKTVETRTYPIPPSYLNKILILVETPGKKGKFKSRMRAFIKFTECFKYSSKKHFYIDLPRHLVDKKSPWAYSTSKGKWGWVVEVVQTFTYPIPYKGRKGIVYTNQIPLDIDL